MSSDTYPCRGLVLKVSTRVIDALELTPRALLCAIVAKYDSVTHELLEEWGWNTKSAFEILQLMVDSDYDFISVTAPMLQSDVSFTVFEYTDDNESEEMSEGLYLEFDESQLYYKELGPIGRALEHRNVLPEFKMWCTYG